MAYPQEFKAACVDEVRKGAKVRDAARKHMVNEVTLRVWCREAGVNLPKRERKTVNKAQREAMAAATQKPAYPASKPKKETIRLCLHRDDEGKYALYLGETRIAGTMRRSERIHEFKVLPEVLRAAIKREAGRGR